VLVRYTSSLDATLPVDGTQYLVGGALGTGTVRYVATPRPSSTPACQRNDLLLPGLRARRLLQLPATAAWSGPLTPRATTTLANGTAGLGGTVCPGTADRKLALLARQQPGQRPRHRADRHHQTGYQAIASASIYDELGGTRYLSTVTAPTSDTLTFSGGTPCRCPPRHPPATRCA
jgi:hypothetical protein